MLLFSRYEYNPQADLIGKGPLARVYKALDKNRNAFLALKIWKTGEEPSIPYIPVTDRPGLIGLSHPNIVRYLAIEEMEKEDAFGETEKIQVCALEWIENGTITQYYQSHKDSQPDRMLQKLLAGLVDGLSYLHRNGIVNLNIKATNILVTETTDGPLAKIADFGVHKLPLLEGKPAYEQDFQSLGDVLSELLGGELPQSFRDLLSPLPVSSDDTQLLTPKPKPAPASSDDTQLLSTKPLPTTAPTLAQSDDTQILTPKPKPGSPPPVSSDDTQILTPKPKPAPASSDDTQLLSTKPLPTTAPTSAQSDDTQILKPKPQVPSSDDTQLLKPKPAPASDDTQILPPRKEEVLSLFNRYEYNPHTGLIGKGGFSRVYKAFDKRLNRWVALKIYKAGEFGDRYSAIAEIRRVVNLDHSNICRYLDIEEIEKENSFGEKEITQICVMELLDGGNFSEYYATHKDDKVIKKLLNDVLNGLSYLHKNGIIHRDIKPANILIKETIDGPVAKITDFGISKISDSINSNSSSALIVSIPYMAPEQLNVKKYGVNEKISYNLDLWSLGVTIYEIITGRVLFKNSEQDSSEQIMTNIMAPELPEKIQELSQPFRDIVAHCIVKDAKDRAQKAEELIVLLHSNYDTVPVQPLSNTVAAVTENKAVPRAKASFLADNDTDEPITKSTRSSSEKKSSQSNLTPESREKKVNEKKLFLGIAAGVLVILVIAGLYFFTGGNKKEDLSSGAVKKTDSSSTASAKTPAQTPAGTTGNGGSSGTTTPANTAGASGGTNPASADPRSSSPAKTDASPSNQQPSTATEHKPKKPTANTEEQDVSAPASGNQKYVLILTTTQSCMVKINQEDYGKLEVGKSLKVYLVPGNYVLQATSLTNSASVYNGNLEVSEKNRSQVGQYKIPLP